MKEQNLINFYRVQGEAQQGWPAKFMGKRFIYYLFYLFLITQARLCFRMMAVIYTDVGQPLECFSQISRQPSLVTVLNYAPSS